MIRSGALWAVALVVSLASSNSFAQQPLKLNKEKSKIDFLGKKTDGQHAGGFKEFTVEAKADFETPANSSLQITIDATSLWSDDAKLTDHLKNPDFFDVRKYPKITFQSTKIESEGEGKAVIHGKMKMLDKEVEVKVPCDVEMNEDSITLKGKWKLDRSKFGMTYGAGKIDNDVEITSNLVFGL
jgi:polyisoprenoid-binding protein YceI